MTIGINRYAAWPQLHNAVADATAAHDRFVALGFEPASSPLLDEAATGGALRRLATDGLAKLERRDSLVVFFAGHGHTHTQEFEDGTVDRIGYLVPVDAEPPGGGASSWLRVDAWLRDLARLPARHLLVILDACHSGIALAIDRSRGATEESLAALASRRSRRVVTSAHARERAADGGPFEGHSLFAGALFEALASAGATGDQVITGAALALRAQRRVIELSQSQQTPDFGRLVLDDGGELLIPVGQAGMAISPVRPPPRLASPLRSYVRRAPVVGDFLDTRAAARRGGRRLPSMIAAIGLVGLAALMLARPWLVAVAGRDAAFWLGLAAPGASWIMALRIVCSTERGTLRYRHAQSLRVTSKIVAVIAVGVLVHRLSIAAAMRDPERVAGYVCAAEQPVQDATVRLLDASGQPASAANGTDRAGYTVLTSARWSLAPLAVAISRPRCGVVVLPAAAPRAEGCAAISAIAKRDNAGRSLPVWRLDRCDEP